MLKEMFKNFIQTLYLKLGNDSSSRKTEAKSRYGNSQAQSGDNSIQVGGDVQINNTVFPNNQNPIKNNEAWENLLRTLNNPQWFIDEIKDPRAKLYQEKIIKDKKKYIYDRCSAITLAEILSHRFSSIYEMAIKAFDNFLKTMNEEEFKTAWLACHKELEKIRNMDFHLKYMKF
jgi:hypothetical protein